MYPIFSERYSLALVEKVIACELDMAETESIGTAMHLLSGNCSGYCYKRSSNSNEWRPYVDNGPSRETAKYDTLALEPTTDENKSDEDLVNRLKNRTMSKEQVELLDSLYRSSSNDEGKNVTAYDRSSLEEAMKDLSMFVVVTSAPTTAPTDDISNVIAYPILYTDNSPETHIVYANGPNIQPLLNLSTLSEVWEFPLGGFSGHQNTNSAFVEPKNYTREIFSRVMTPSSLPIAERMNPGITRLSSDIELTLEGNVDATVRRFVNLLVRPVTDVRVKSIFRKAVVKTVATSRIRINNPRYIVKGDYVKGRAKEHRGVVDKIITEDEKIGSGGKKRTIIIEYRVEKFSALNKPTFVAIPVKDTVKLSDEEKMVPEILRHDDIFFGKRLPRRELDAQATKRRSLQWANSNTLRKENVKFCGIVSPSFDVLCQVFI